MKYITILLMMLFVLPLVNADLGTFKQGDCIQLLSPSDGTSMNISSISYPKNASTLFLSTPMTKNDKTFNYTFCDTQLTGQYIYTSYDNLGNVWVNSFEINSQGKENGTDGTYYIIMFSLLIVLLGGSTYASVTIPFNNPRNRFGELVGVDYMKYLKIGSITCAYVVCVALSYFAWNLSFGVLEFTEMANLFQVIFRILYIGLYLVIPFFFVFGLIMWIQDSKIKSQIERGFTIE